ncbi:methylmalonyl-CoA mutase subunit beta [Flavobacterium capsici]|uniref:Methylmalonyl-CoA mutase subunit beta n=1 Tax=Flavobacterium capsici TaxID=3075618 RepID=A0AA96EV68_9FLAO|nr:MULTISPECIES: methylmalonyl-CoA mutase subunit beta [unclassified Flavobacterium]WNM17783.1 methylmalonyl-CoA mutase subunit beta [Flavobacterium sp. PMR2A8]WNM21836.1 methylmalonyl-CoA mutase subunit beta [Flavobacterium sp. PMTSA4]
MEKNLFDSFEKVGSKQWKQKIQYELKGADYNDTLVWESLEGIKVKPFYHYDEFEIKVPSATPATPFSILQNIFVHDVAKSNKRALETLNRGAESIRFTIENESVSVEELMQNLPKDNTTYFFYLPFLSIDFAKTINDFSAKNGYKSIVLIDPIHQLGKDGNWFENLDKDFEKLNQTAKLGKSIISVNSSLYQNAGANMVQQLAYTLAHVNEYFNRVENISQQITIEVSVGSNYFFEIAKLRALRILFNTLAKEYNHKLDCIIVATPTKRNKTLYDYNVNMLRTTTECMSAILGGADYIANLPYDALYHKDNEFGDRIARNQLLVLKHESYFDLVNNAADGSYYIEEITNQLAEKALLLFKDIEANGGLITQLIEGTIQRKISESAAKEQEWFDSGKEVLLGTNKYPNKNDKMKHDLELYPFVKQNPRKTLIVPIIEKRLAEKLEQERLAQEE